MSSKKRAKNGLKVELLPHAVQYRKQRLSKAEQYVSGVCSAIYDVFGLYEAYGTEGILELIDMIENGEFKFRGAALERYLDVMARPAHLRKLAKICRNVD